MKKSISRLCALGLVIGVSLTNVVAGGTYSYGTKLSSNGKSFTANTYASSDPCSVTSEGTYLLNDYKTTKTSHYVGKSQDPITKIAVASGTVPSNAVYYTIVKSTHRVGNNYYKSSDAHK